MKLEFNENKLNELTKCHNCFFLYGNDLGQVRQAKNRILETVMPDYRKNLSFININISILKNDPLALWKEYNTPSLFSEKKVILFEMLDGEYKEKKENEKKESENNDEKQKHFSIIDIIEETMSIKRTDTYLIITSGDLDWNSPLLKFVEMYDNIGAMKFVADNSIGIKDLVQQKLQGYKYSNDVVEELVGNFGGDRMIILNELDKLLLYKLQEKTITLNDIKNTIQDNSIVAMDDFFFFVATLNENDVFLKIKKIIENGEQPILYIRSVISYFMKLQLARYLKDNSKSEDEFKSKAKEHGISLWYKDENDKWQKRPIYEMLTKKDCLTGNEINKILTMLLDEECKIKGKKIL